MSVSELFSNHQRISTGFPLAEPNKRRNLAVPRIVTTYDLMRPYVVPWHSGFQDHGCRSSFPSRAVSPSGHGLSPFQYIHASCVIKNERPFILTMYLVTIFGRACNHTIHVTIMSVAYRSSAFLISFAYIFNSRYFKLAMT